MRELRRMVAGVRANPGDIELVSANDVSASGSRLHLPLIQCTDCRCTGWLSRLPTGQALLSKDLDLIYSTWFGEQPEAVRLYSPKGLSQPQVQGVAQHLCTSCGILNYDGGTCKTCGCPEMVEVFRVTATRTINHQNGLTSTRHDTTCPACGGRNAILLGARNATLGSVVIEQTWSSPYNDDKKLIAFSDAVQDAAHRAGFFTARTYMNTVRTGLAQVIDQVAQPTCTWNTFLAAARDIWSTPGPLEMDDQRFVSEFIGPNMLWQRDWAERLLKEDHLPKNSPLPERVRKRLAWQAFAEFTYLSRRGRNLETVGKAVLAPPAEAVNRASAALLPVLHNTLGLQSLDQPTVFRWLWGFLTHLKSRGAVTHPEMGAFMEDGKVFVFAKMGGRNEWLPGLGPRASQPRFLRLGPPDKGFDALVSGQAATFYQVWLAAICQNAGQLLAKNAEPDIYGKAIDALAAEQLLVKVATPQGTVVGLNADKLVLDTRVTRIVSSQGKKGLAVPSEVADRLLGMPCLQSPQEMYAEKQDGEHWFARQFSRGDLRRIFSAEHTGLLERDKREALEQRFKSKTPKAWYENLLSATPTLEMGVDIGDLSSVMLCSVPPTQASYLQRIGRAGRRDGNAFTSTLADGASPHDLYFFEDIRLALEHIKGCSCNANPNKDGCYRCVYQYRLGRDMELVSRNRARAILEALDSNLTQLEEVATIADIYVNPNFDSELEAKFIESLRRLGGTNGLPAVRLVKEIVQGKSGYLLEVGTQRYWIEPQVDLTPKEGVLPVPDEVGFELASNGEVVAECELAWTKRKVVLLLEHHADTEPVWLAHGWQTVSATTGWPTHLSGKLNESSPSNPV